MRVPDEVLECVAFIGLPAEHPSGLPGSRLRGTGFFVSIPFSFGGRGGFSYLVTAKHVARNLVGHEHHIRLNGRNGEAATGVIKPDSRWYFHPHDESADVAAIPFRDSAKVFQFRNVGCEMLLRSNQILEFGIGAGDEVAILGLFTRHVGLVKNTPIVRSGSIAMLPREKIPTKLGPMDAHLIEARSIGGISGSPVFVRTSNQFNTGKTYLLGLMHGHWDIPPEAMDDAVPGGIQPARVNLGIAIVVPAQSIIDVLYQTDLVAARQRAEDKVKQERGL